MQNSLLDLTIECIQAIMHQNKRPTTPLTPTTDILKDTSIDSLDLLEVIVLLEKKTGKTPFRKGFIPFNTIQELADLYQ